MFLALLSIACTGGAPTTTNGSSDSGIASDTGGDNDGGNQDLDTTCPSQAGLVDGRVWTFMENDTAAELGSTIDVERTVTDLGGGVYTLVDAWIQTLSNDPEMLLTRDVQIHWRCVDGALLFDGYESTIVQSYGSTYSYGFSFEPAMTLLSTDAALGSTWQDDSVVTYWYDDPNSARPYGQYEMTNAITTSEQVADTWDSLVAESLGQLTYEDGYSYEPSYSRAWADGVGLTADGDLAIELVSYEDR
jgi:hypothetical protein